MALATALLSNQYLRSVLSTTEPQGSGSYHCYSRPQCYSWLLSENFPAITVRKNPDDEFWSCQGYSIFDKTPRNFGFVVFRDNCSAALPGPL